MRRPPLLLVIVFVGISILTAVLFETWQNRRSQKESIIGKIESASTSFVETFESPQSCSETRRKFSHQMEIFPPVYREVRSRVSADLPRACLSYIMTRPQSEENFERGFSRCAGLEAPVQKQNDPPCVTESYVNVVYNTFGDVTSCLEVPQKDLVPRIFRESGFHFTTLGSGRQVGIGQMSHSTLARAERLFPQVRERIANSDAESCRTLLTYLQRLPKLAVPQGESAPSCGMFVPPQNPLRQLLYVAIRYEQDSAIIERSLLRFEVDKLMRQAGLIAYEPEQLRQILMALSHRAGPIPAVVYLKNYLEFRIALTQTGAGQVTQTDFNWLARQPASSGQGITFSEYLSEFASTELARDLMGLSSAAQTLNSVFKEGTCVPESYLSLSL